MALSHFFPHRSGRNYWDVWDYPQKVYNQNFGRDLNDWDDLLMVTSPRSEMQRSGYSNVKNDDNKFRVRLDCSHFTPNEITVKVIDNNIIIHGKHEEKLDSHGWVKREFTRKYSLPYGCDPKNIISSLSSNGILTISAPKGAPEEPPKNEIIVPITYE